MNPQFTDGSAIVNNVAAIENWGKIYDYLGKEFDKATSL